MIETGHELEDVGDSLSWGAFASFIKYARPESALVNALNPDVSSWASTTKTNMILADIFDMLAQINANLVAIGSRKPARAIKPYPRPWAKEPDSVQKIGKGALPKNELRKWIERKRAEFNGRNRSSTGDDNRHASA